MSNRHEADPKNLEVMTRKAWEALPEAHRYRDREGRPYRLRLEPETGATVLVPVRITDTRARS